MDDPMLWAGIWLAVAIVFAGAEIMIAGTFFLLPFAAGAVVAAVASLFGAPVVASWGVFLIISFISFLAMRPLSNRLAQTPEVKGVGANRLIGSKATVIEAIPADASGSGRIKLGGEQWVANAEGVAVAEGTEVTILEIRGTQAIVRPVPQLEV